MTDNETENESVKKSSGALWFVIILILLAGLGAYIFMQEQTQEVSVAESNPVVESPDPVVSEVIVEEEIVLEAGMVEETIQDSFVENVEVVEVAEGLAEEAIEEMTEDVIDAVDVSETEISFVIDEPLIEAPVEVIEEGPAELDLNDMQGSLTLSSSAFFNEKRRLPLTHTCHRSNTSPAVAWENVPEGTKSFVLFMEQRKADADPYVYWVLFNIPGDKRELAADLPKQGEFADGTRYARNDHGVSDYAGPCDPRGRTDYVFRLFAIDTVIEKQVDVNKGDLIRAMNGHILDTAEFDFHHILRP